MVTASVLAVADLNGMTIWEKSTPPRTRPIGGIMTSLTKEFTIAMKETP
jgi:hypothetical protein